MIEVTAVDCAEKETMLMTAAQMGTKMLLVVAGRGSAVATMLAVDSPELAEAVATHLVVVVAAVRVVNQHQRQQKG